MDAVGMGELATALEGAWAFGRTWINGGMDTFGPSGSVIAAMMAVATGIYRSCVSGRCGRATFQQFMKEITLSPGGARHQLPDAVRRDVGRTHLGAQRAQSIFATAPRGRRWAGSR